VHDALLHLFVAFVVLNELEEAVEDLDTLFHVTEELNLGQQDLY